MKKLDFKTKDITSVNIEKIEELFPGCVAETADENGGLKKAIDFDKLKQELSNNVLEGDESYEFNWVGKKAAMVEANKPTTNTLRPNKEDSVNWDNTENLYIEGDNLEVLKLFQESYLGKVKMIYIDPPYNTGNDFVYRDDFKQSREDYEEDSGETDEEGNRLFRNTDSNGRFHSDWCSMIYSRLKLAKNLLTEDGAIFISIDDNENSNLKNICDEIFGENNFVSLFTLMSNPRGSQNSKFVSSIHEYILVYSKNKNLLNITGLPKSESSLNEFREVDSNGRKYRLLGLRKRGGAWKKEDRPNMYYQIFVNPENGSCSLEADNDHHIEVVPKRPSGELGRWTWSKDKFQKESDLLVGKRVNGLNNDEKWDIFRKDYIDDEFGVEKTTKIKTIWTEKDTNYQNAKNEIREMFGNSEMFDFPKPTYLPSKLLRMFSNDKNLAILDFFSGSATTAHAVMQLNAEDGGTRKYIMVQLPEKTNEKSEAYKAGYKNICEIGKERIRRAAKKIHEDNPEAKFDDGFRDFKLDSSNMKDVYYSPNDIDKNIIELTESNIKEDRTDLDLLFQCLLDWGLPISKQYKTEKIDGFNVHFYDEDALVACFDKDISEDCIKQIAKCKPQRVVFRDSSFKDSSSRINVEEIFKMLSPKTTVKVI